MRSVMSIYQQSETQELICHRKLRMQNPKQFVHQTARKKKGKQTGQRAKDSLIAASK